MCYVFKICKRWILPNFATINVDNDYFYRAVDCIMNKGDLPPFVDVKLSKKSKTNYVDENNEDIEDYNKECKVTAVTKNECFPDGSSQFTSIQLVFYYYKKSIFFIQ